MNLKSASEFSGFDGIDSNSNSNIRYNSGTLGTLGLEKSVCRSAHLAAVVRAAASLHAVLDLVGGAALYGPAVQVGPEPDRSPIYKETFGIIETLVSDSAPAGGHIVRPTARPLHFPDKLKVVWNLFNIQHVLNSSC